MKTIALVALAAATLVMLAALDPSTSAVFPPCLFRALTGWQCPGCGSARALHALLHGDFASAVAANPLAVAVVPLVSLETVRHAAGARPSLASRLDSRAILALAGGLIVFAIGRNM